MSNVIKILLQEKEAILKRIEDATAPFKDELNKVDCALAVLGHYTEAPSSSPIKTNIPTMAYLSEKKGPTIKQRVRQALSLAYPNGAHYSDILEYLNKTWPDLPEVKRTSLSPQLTRLRKKDKIIDLDEEKGIWYLVENQEAINESTPAKAEVDSNSAMLLNLNPNQDSGG